MQIRYTKIAYFTSTATLREQQDVRSTSRSPTSPLHVGRQRVSYFAVRNDWFQPAVLFSERLIASILSGWHSLNTIRLLDAAHINRTQRQILREALSNGCFTEANFAPRVLNGQVFCDWVLTKYFILHDATNLGRLAVSDYDSCITTAESLHTNTDHVSICLACWLLAQVRNVPLTVTTTQWLFKLASGSTGDLNVQRIACRAGITAVHCMII